eukprot:1394173-Amorphochlora_amoeboformis.AAC.1
MRWAADPTTLNPICLGGTPKIPPVVPHQHPRNNPMLFQELHCSIHRVETTHYHRYTGKPGEGGAKELLGWVCQEKAFR